MYWVLLLDGNTELETLRKIRKMKCIPTMVTVLWHRSRGDYELHTIALELLFEVCRSERLSEEDLGTSPTSPPTPPFVLSLVKYSPDYRLYIRRVYRVPFTRTRRRLRRALQHARLSINRTAPNPLQQHVSSETAANPG